jgi:hypothetical protein
VIVTTSTGDRRVSAVITFTPDLAMAAGGGYERMCFEGITGQNLRSRFCVRLRVTLSSPMFDAIQIEHRVFLGCKLISHNVLIRRFLQSQFAHKPVNLIL